MPVETRNVQNMDGDKIMYQHKSALVGRPEDGLEAGGAYKNMLRRTLSLAERRRKAQSEGPNGFVSAAEKSSTAKEIGRAESAPLTHGMTPEQYQALLQAQAGMPSVQEQTTTPTPTQFFPHTLASPTATKLDVNVEVSPVPGNTLRRSLSMGQSLKEKWKQSKNFLKGKDGAQHDPGGISTPEAMSPLAIDVRTTTSDVLSSPSYMWGVPSPRGPTDPTPASTRVSRTESTPIMSHAHSEPCTPEKLVETPSGDGRALTRSDSMGRLIKEKFRQSRAILTRTRTNSGSHSGSELPSVTVNGARPQPIHLGGTLKRSNSSSRKLPSPLVDRATSLPSMEGQGERSTMEGGEEDAGAEGSNMDDLPEVTVCRSRSAKNVQKFFGAEVSPVGIGSVSDISLDESFRTFDHMLNLISVHYTPCPEDPHWAVYKDMDWPKLVGADAATQFTDKKKKQLGPLWELFKTEASYLDSMLIVREEFRKPLLELQGNRFLNHVDPFKLYINIDDVIELSSRLVRQMHTLLLPGHPHPSLGMALPAPSPKGILDPCMLLEAFQNFESLADPLVKYCANHPDSMRYLRECTRHSDFLAYMNWCESRERCGRKRLPDFLVMPMQRLTKYPLLLSALAKHSGDQPNLVAGLNKIIKATENVLRLVNEEVRRLENWHKVTELQIQMAQAHPHMAQEVHLLAPGRELLQEGRLVRVGRTGGRGEVQAYLFTDILLLRRPDRKGLHVELRDVPQQPLALNEITVEDGEDPPGKEQELRIHYQHKGTLAVVQLQAPSVGEKRQWVANIVKAQHEMTIQRLSLSDSVLHLNRLQEGQV